MKFIKLKRMGKTILVMDKNGAVIAYVNNGKTDEVCEPSIGEAAEIEYVKSHFKTTLNKLP